MSEEVDNFYAFCRVCLQLPDESQILDVQLIYDEDANLTYSECFTICTQIELLANDGPQNLCKSCGLELQIAYDFYKKIEDSKRKLQQMQKIHTSVSEEALPDNLEDCDGDIEEYQCLEDLDTSQDAESMIEKCRTDRELSTLKDDKSAIRQQLTWKEAVVTVANKSHLPLQDAAAKNNNPGYFECAIIEEMKSEHSVEYIDELQTNRKRYAGKISCDFCQKIYPNRSRMLLHRRLHEANRPRFPCDQCSRTYSTKQGREAHISAVHKKTGYSCSVCGKIYAIKKGLEVHMRYHTGEFPFVCELCGRKFAQMSHLKTHKNVKHNSVRYCCEFPDCRKYFTSSSSLRNHEFSHGDMPFKCEFCNNGYPAKSKLKVHVRRKHGMEMTLEQLECMRKFHVERSKLNLIKLAAEDPLEE